MMIKGMAQLPYRNQLAALEAECRELRWALQSRAVWEDAILERQVERAKLKLAMAEEDEEDKEDNDAAPDTRNRHSSPLGVHRIDAFRSLSGSVEK
jgi:hypothetical protein